MINLFLNNKGFTLIELVIIIIILGILTGVATRKFAETTETARIEATKAELNSLAYAIGGNPGIYTNGARADFGYIGDIGSLPANLDALATNPGLGTWDGPYIQGDFQSVDFKKDGWNTDYVYSDTLLRSTGSGTNIDKLFANSSSELLSNILSGYILDASSGMPGIIYDDSLMIILSYPDGSGAITNASLSPDSKGNFSFSSIPIGNQTLRVIYIPDSDTMSYEICITPNSSNKMEIRFPHDLW